MEDIAPQLVENVTGEFRRLYDASAKISGLLAKVKAKTATYAEAQKYAIEVSRLIGMAWEKYVSSDTLPDGRMYYNIAARLVPAALDENHALVAQYAADVQKGLNDRAGIGLKAQRAEQDEDRVKGLVDLASSAEQYDEVADKLLSAFENFSQHIVDETIRKNADFHQRSGLSPKIIRRSNGKCCTWCRSLAGTYDYPDVDRDVYRRHDNCRCTVLYDPADGSKLIQNVHTKRLTTAEDHDRIEARRILNLNTKRTFNPKDYRSRLESYVEVDRDAVLEAAKARKKHGHAGVYADAMVKSMPELKKSIASRTAQVEEHDNKIRNPQQYVPHWDSLDPRYRDGLIRKWEKDKKRNAEQATIELAVFEERFGL